MRIKVCLTLSWVVSCGTPPGGYAGHTLPPSPSRRSSLWCSAVRPSRSGNASRRRARAPRRRGRRTAAGSAPSPPGSAPRHEAFFRLARLPHARLVALEARVLQQPGLARVADALALGHLLVVRLARVRAAQVADPTAPGVDDDHVLVGVGLLLAAVVQPLFLGVFRALAPPLGAVDDQIGRLALPPLMPGETAGAALGEDAQAVQGAHEDRQQPVDPAVRPGLAEAEEAAQQRLQRVGLLVDENEQQLVPGAAQHGRAARTEAAVAALARVRARGGEGARVRPR